MVSIFGCSILGSLSQIYPAIRTKGTLSVDNMARYDNVVTVIAIVVDAVT